MATQELETLPIIGEKQVASLLEWQPLINAMETALSEFSAGKVAQPVRQIVPVPGHDAIIAAMPAIGTAMAVKIVTLYHSNAGTEIPTHQGVILVLDKETGSPLALLDGRLITEMRTAAGSAAAVRKLAPKSVDVVTIMGNGVQAEAHVDALAEVIEWKELRLWARDETKGRKVADRVGATFFSGCGSRSSRRGYYGLYNSRKATNPAGCLAETWRVRDSSRVEHERRART